MRLACIVHKFESSSSCTKYASAASCNAIIIAGVTLKPHTKSLQNLTNQVLKWELMYVSVVPWIFGISVSLSVQPFQAGTYAANAVPMLCLTGSWVAFLQKWTISCPPLPSLLYVYSSHVVSSTSETEIKCVAACQSGLCLLRL